MMTSLCGLAQAHMGRLDVPITDYVGDTKSALDNSVRILQAIADVAADAGWLRTTLATMRIVQGLMQVRIYPSATPGCTRCIPSLDIVCCWLTAQNLETCKISASHSNQGHRCCLPAQCLLLCIPFWAM